MQPQSVFSREQYNQPDFWEQRYASKKIYFDWYVEYPELKYTLQSLYKVSRNAKILMLGCGNSKLSEQMYDDGYHNLVNIDISESVISQMKEDCDRKGKKMEWLVMDGTKMTFPDGEFDVVLDKGTIDAVISGKILTISDPMLRQTRRVIKPYGKIIIITHGPPDGRKKVFEGPLPFDMFSYEFVKLPLSDMAMMINLMRSNLKDKPLKCIVQNQQALQRSMLEYRIMQIRNRNRKPQALRIMWSKPQQLSKTGQKAQEKKEQVRVQVKQESKQPPKQQLQGQPTKEPQPAPVQAPAKKQVLYNPQKQTHCYVYLIQHKPHLRILPSVSVAAQQPDVRLVLKELNLQPIKFDESSTLLQFNPDVQDYIDIITQQPSYILAAIRHLQLQNVQLPRIVIRQQGQSGRKQAQESLMLRMHYKINKSDQYQGFVQSLSKQKMTLKGKFHNSCKGGYSRQVFNQIQSVYQLADQLPSSKVKLAALTPLVYQNLELYSKTIDDPTLPKRILNNQLTVSALQQSDTADIQFNFKYLAGSDTTAIKQWFEAAGLVVQKVDKGCTWQNPYWLLRSLNHIATIYHPLQSHPYRVCQFESTFNHSQHHPQLSIPNTQLLTLSSKYAICILSQLLRACTED